MVLVAVDDERNERVMGSIVQTAVQLSRHHYRLQKSAFASRIQKSVVRILAWAKRSGGAWQNFYA